MIAIYIWGCEVDPQNLQGEKFGSGGTHKLVTLVLGKQREAELQGCLAR